MENIEELVERVASGDMNAFAALYQEVGRQVYYTCLGFLGNEEDAKDITQDAFIAALTSLHQLEDKSRFVPWINRIAVNRCKNFLAKKKPVYIEPEEMAELPVEAEDNFLPESYVINEEKRKIVLKIMQEELTVVEYQSILLYYFDQMTAQEVADCMNCPKGTVTYRLSAARAKIKQGVQKYEDISGQKLYCVAGVPLLAAIFIYETRNIVLPNITEQIFGSVSFAAQNGVNATNIDKVNQIVNQKGIAKGSAMVGESMMKKVLISIGVGMVAVSAAAVAIVLTFGGNKDTNPEENPVAISSDSGTGVDNGENQSDIPVEDDNDSQTNDGGTFVSDKKQTIYGGMGQVLEYRFMLAGNEQKLNNKINAICMSRVIYVAMEDGVYYVTNETEGLDRTERLELISACTPVDLIRISGGVLVINSDNSAFTIVSNAGVEVKIPEFNVSPTVPLPENFDKNGYCFCGIMEEPVEEFGIKGGVASFQYMSNGVLYYSVLDEFGGTYQTEVIDDFYVQDGEDVKRDTTNISNFTELCRSGFDTWILWEGQLCITDITIMPNGETIARIYTATGDLNQHPVFTNVERLLMHENESFVAAFVKSEDTDNLYIADTTSYSTGELAIDVTKHGFTADDVEEVKISGLELAVFMKDGSILWCDNYKEEGMELTYLESISEANKEGHVIFSWMNELDGIYYYMDDGQWLYSFD